MASATGRRSKQAIYGAVMTVIAFELFAMMVPQLLGFAMALLYPGASVQNPIGVPLGLQYAAVLLSAALPLALAVWAAGRFGHSNRPQPRQELPLRKSVPVLLPIFLAVTIAASLLFGLAAPQTDPMTMPARGAGLWVEFVCVCLIPALGEEYLFRGTVQTMLQPLGPWAAVWGQALLFGAAHAFGAPMLTAVVSGFALGLIYTLTGDLKLGMILHGANNFLGFWENYASQYADTSLTMAVIVLLDLLLFAWAAAAAVYIKRSSWKNRLYPADLSTGHGRLVRSPVFWAALVCLVLTQRMNG